MSAFGDFFKFWRELSFFEGPDFRSLETKPDADAFLFSILTYNVNFALRPGSANLEQVIFAIASCGADVVCLQETTPAWEAELARLHQVYPHRLFHRSGGAGGSGFLSRHPFVGESRAIPPTEGGWFPTFVATIAVSPSLALQVANCHLRPPVNADGSAGMATARLTDQYRLGEARQLLERLTLGNPTVILGDFNESDGAPALAHLQEDGAFRDALGEFVPKERETHRWPLGSLVMKKRLDHILYQPARLECVQCYVISGYEENASDHQPVQAYFKMATEQPEHSSGMEY